MKTKAKIGIGAGSIVAIGSIAANIYMLKVTKEAKEACKEYKEANELLMSRINKQAVIELILERCRGLYAINELNEELKLHAIISEIRADTDEEFKRDYDSYISHIERAKKIMKDSRKNV